MSGVGDEERARTGGGVGSVCVFGGLIASGEGRLKDSENSVHFIKILKKFVKLQKLQKKGQRRR